jgi:YVTN family beta-propeller protein
MKNFHTSWSLLTPSTRVTSLVTDDSDMSEIAKNASLLAGNVHRITFVVLGVICVLLSPVKAQQASGNTENTDASPPKNTIVAKIAVGSDPVAAVVSPDSSKVYVASGLANSISVINASTNTVTSVIQLKVVPAGIALTPDGSTLYVTAGSAGKVIVIDTSTNTVTAVIKVASAALELAVSPDGKSIYVPCLSEIDVISTATKHVTATVPVPDQAEPIQVVFNRDGTDAYAVCLVTVLKNRVLGGLLQIDTSSLKVAEYLWNRRGYGSEVVDTHNTLFVAERFRNKQGATVPALEIFNTVTKKSIGKISFIPYDGGVYGTPAVTPDGKYLYVASSPDIIIVDIATQKAVGEPIPIGGAHCLAIAPNGKYLYAGNDIGEPNQTGVLFVIAISAQ